MGKSNLDQYFAWEKALSSGSIKEKQGGWQVMNNILEFSFQIWCLLCGFDCNSLNTIKLKDLRKMRIVVQQNWKHSTRFKKAG